MKHSTALIFSCFVLGSGSLAGSGSLKPLSDAEAAGIVEAQEEAKERAKDRREAELRGADIRATASAQIGGSQVIFNVVEPGATEVKGTESSATEAQFNEGTNIRLGADSSREKEAVQFILSGTVWDERISELWWNYEGVRYRVFANANFLLFPGLGEVEDEDTRYTLLAMSTGRRSSVRGLSEEKWRPSIADFSSETLEYIVIDPKDDAMIEPAAFAGLEAVLQHYAANHEEMRIRHDNAKKLREARKAYLEAHPPKERDTIINFRPRR